MQTTKIAKTRQLADGTIEALSSDGRKIYRVRLAAQPSCECLAGQNGRRCYHVTTAQQRYAGFVQAPKRWVQAQVSDLYA